MDFGNPIRFFVTTGQIYDYINALDLVEAWDIEVLIAEKGCDANLYSWYSKEG